MPTGPANRLLPALRRAVLGHQAAERSDGELVSAFVNKQDADSFAELVHRHGPMVLGVCRRVVGDPHSADDAFQAVFLVLARRAAAVRPRERVGNWLYGVAYRTAIKARAVLARRRSREKQVDAMPEPPVHPPADVWSDLQPVIDEELNRLPDKLRLPVVLCDLEGRPQRQVAARLKVPPATLATRLASARRLLADRLSRRGVTLSGGALAVLLGERAAAAVVPPRLADAVVQAAEATAIGEPVSALVSAHAVQLSEGVMRMMLVAKLKAIGAAALSVLALTGGLGLGLVPAHAGDEPTVRVVVQPANAPQNANPQPRPPVDDATYLNRLSLDLRGTRATPLEILYFLADPDPKKREKVIDWFIADEAVKTYLAKRLNVPPERLVIVRLDSSGKQYLTLRDTNTLAIEGSVRLRDNSTVVTEYLNYNANPEVQTGTFLYGLSRNSDAGASGAVVVNEQYYELIRRVPDDPQTTNRIQVWDVNSGVRVLVVGQDGVWKEGQPYVGIWVQDAADPRSQPQPQTYYYATNKLVLGEPVAESDADFLKRVVMSARGTPPTAVEEKYFVEDKDPKKREKLLDELLKDPAVARKVGDDWKKKMLEPPTVTYTYRVVEEPVVVKDYTWKVKTLDLQEQRLTKLVDELLAANKPDDQILDGITLAVVGRLPTESEKKLTQAAVSKATDRKAAWLDVAKALAATEEAKKLQGK